MRMLWCCSVGNYIWFIKGVLISVIGVDNLFFIVHKLKSVLLIEFFFLSRNIKSKILIKKLNPILTIIFVSFSII